MLATYLNNIQMDNRSSNMPKLDGEKMSIKTRFGELPADLSKAVYFPKGLYGFPEDLHFVLLNFPSVREDLGTFKILQCLNDHSISIPVLPAGYKNDFIEEEDMAECLKMIEIKKEDFAMAFIVTSQKQGDSFKLHVNTKAPIVIDTHLQMAVQYVFTDNKYSVSQPLDSKKL